MFEFMIGHIHPENVFWGDIKKCTKEAKTIVTKQPYLIDDFEIKANSTKIIPPKTEDYKKDAILIRIPDQGFVDLDTLKDSFQIFYHLRKDIHQKEKELKTMIMTTYPRKKDDLFVNPGSLQPYYGPNQNFKVRVKQLKLNQQYISYK